MSVGDLTFGAFRLDPRQRVLWRSGVAVDLGGRASDILCSLVTARGAIVSKDALMAAVWPGQAVEENALQAQMSGLRRALGPAGQGYIVTVPGRGYRFVCEDATTVDPVGSVPHRPPSIAVLAFANLSADQDDEYFASGMAEDLITQLSRSRSWLVVSRNSSFMFKGRNVDVRQVGQELGVRYVLEGSVRRNGNRIRVTAQLIDAEDGVHVWAERYDRALTDLFATQDEISLAVSRAIEPAVESAEQSRAIRKRPDSLDAWESWQRAQSYLDTEEWGPVDMWLRRSMALDTGFALPHASRSFYLISAAAAGRLPFQETRAEAEAESRQAIQLDPDEPFGHAALSISRSNLRDWGDAAHSATRAVALGPSSWPAQCAMIFAQAGAGRLTEAQEHVELLRQISPRGTGRRMSRMLTAYLHFVREEYDAAAATAEALVVEHPNYTHPYWIFLSSLGHMGRRGDASGPLTRWMVVTPGQSAQFAELGVTWLSIEASDRALAGLRAAGWPG